jgi:hypothetical protein
MTLRLNVSGIRNKSNRNLYVLRLMQREDPLGEEGWLAPPRCDRLCFVGQTYYSCKVVRFRVELSKLGILTLWMYGFLLSKILRM